MIVLFDYDSMIYKATYKIVDIKTMKQWFYKSKSREWMQSEIVELSINRLCNMGDEIFTEIENTGIEIESVEYYITAAKNSIRKKLVPTYKANRRPNKWVNKVRKYLLEKNFAITSDVWEADDLIYDRAKELGNENCVILSIDKDLKQIPGVHFNYYRKKSKDESGNDKSEIVGLEIVSPKEAEYKFWFSMLVGDGSDNIKGCKGIGKVKASKILIESNELENLVKETYEKTYKELWEIEFNLNYRLLKLGK